MRWRDSVVLGSLAVVVACHSTTGMGGEGECREGDFGTVMIELLRSPGEVEDPFVGTARISAFLDYGDCLSDFYAEHPEYLTDVEGAACDAWVEGCLCDPDNYGEPTVDCGVIAIQHQIDTQSAVDTVRGVIEYTVSDDELEGRHLPFGPLPTDALTGCESVVTLRGGSVVGEDGAGNVIWQIASFENPTAKVGQGASIQIWVERAD